MTISQQPLVLWRRSWRQNLIHFVAYKFCMGHFCIRAKLKKWTARWKLTLFDYLSDYIFCKIYRHHGWPLGTAGLTIFPFIVGSGTKKKHVDWYKSIVGGFPPTWVQKFTHGTSKSSTLCHTMIICFDVFCDRCLWRGGPRTSTVLYAFSGRSASHPPPSPQVTRAKEITTIIGTIHWCPLLLIAATPCLGWSEDEDPKPSHPPPLPE